MFYGKVQFVVIEKRTPTKETIDLCCLMCFFMLFLTSTISHDIIITAITTIVAIIITITTLHCCIEFIRWRAQHSHNLYINECVCVCVCVCVICVWHTHSSRLLSLIVLLFQNNCLIVYPFSFETAF